MNKYALISVSDKSGIVELAKELVKLKIKILSTGGTAKTLRQAEIEVLDVSDYTGYPELMNGRVKTLHPKVHGGLLALRENKNHLEQARDNDIIMIDFIIVNLYPFEETIKNNDVSLVEAIENIDIGGPSMLRSAAKNYQSVTVITESEDYDLVVSELKERGQTSLNTRQLLALKVFQKTANYDGKIHAFLNEQFLEKSSLQLNGIEGETLRYGENPHQEAKIFVDDNKYGLPQGKVLHGKAMSYNNFLDADASVEIIKEFKDVPAVSVIKHGNPCGMATGQTLLEAMNKAWEGDIVSAFGSVISCTQTVDLKTAQFLKGKFVEIIIAPNFQVDALTFLKEKSRDIRIIKLDVSKPSAPYHYRFIQGGILQQKKDLGAFEKFEIVTQAKQHASKDLYAFTYKVCKYVKSNAIVIASEYKKGQCMVLGIGAGQPNRVDAIRKLAGVKALENVKRLYPHQETKEILKECVLASDAFFPFSDNIDYVNELNIKNVIQPGGSKKDEEVIRACDKHGISMVFTGMRHFYH